MAILNYTTTISAEKTVGEIHSILAKAGASEIAYEHSNGQVVAVKFQIIHADQPLWFRMAPRPDGVLVSMNRDRAERRYRTASQAHRTAWRILKDAIEAQMAIYQTQQGDIAEIFLPYALDSNNQTFYAAFTESRVKALKAAN